MSSSAEGSADYVPSTIPYDECRKFFECEKHANECKSYQEYVGASQSVQVHTGTTSATKMSAAEQEQVKQLQQMAICVEKFESTPATSSNAQQASKYQQAAFLLSTLWGVRDTIKISFMDPLPDNYPGQQPQWDGGSLIPPTSRKPAPQGTKNAPGTCSTMDDCKSLGLEYVCSAGKCTMDLMPQWYTRDLVNMNMKPGVVLTPEDEALEKRVRALDPIEAIQIVVQERIAPLVGLKLEFVETDGDIRVALDNRKGSWSMVGTQCRQVPANEPTMNFGWLDVATIIHEFCHALGMIHEHQNPFGKGIDWNLKKVFAWANSTQGWDMYTTCQNITKRYNMDLVNGSEYDPDSIMLYSYPAQLTNNNKATYRNIVLSESDKKWLSSIYPPKEGTPRTFPSREQQQASSDQKTAARRRVYYIGAASLFAVGSLAYWAIRRMRSKKK